MQFLLPTFACTVLLSPGLNAPLPYWVNTHQIMALLAANRSVNLKHFLADLDLTKVRYSRRFADRAEAFAAEEGVKVTVANTAAIDLIGAGAVLEDDDKRFYNHFFDPLNNKPGHFLWPFNRVNARADQWALTGKGATRRNVYCWKKALDDYFTGAITQPKPNARHARQELLFATLGYVTHLIQDCCQPSHARNDAHGLSFQPFRSEIEYWAGRKVNAGFMEPGVSAAINRQRAIYYPTTSQFYRSAAAFANRNFFSDSTIYKYYPQPKGTSTGLRTEKKGLFYTEYVISKVLKKSNHFLGARLARVEKNILGQTVDYTLASHEVLLDNAELLVSRAVGLCEGLINHMFRGRLEMSYDPVAKRVKVKNISDPTTVNNLSDIEFANGNLVMHYETESGLRIQLPKAHQPARIGSLKHQASVSIPGNVLGYLQTLRSSTTNPDIRPREDRLIVAFWDGTIGLERGLAASVFSALPASFGKHHGLFQYNQFGAKVDRAGDVNGDGYPDVLVRGEGYKPPTGPFYPGVVRVISGVGGTALHTFRDWWQDAAAAGDIDQDGHADILVSLLWTSGRTAGFARVLSGKTGGSLRTFWASRFIDAFASVVDGAGDVNKDGVPDIIVGAPGFWNRSRITGSATVFSGKDGKVLYTFSGIKPDEFFGFTVSAAGDVNNDGYADVMIGAKNTTATTPRQFGFNGHVTVFSGKDGKVIHQIDGVGGESLGWSLADVGDIDKDGHADILVGALGGGGSGRGAAYLYSGRSGVLMRRHDGDASWHNFGYSVAWGGDVNKDGYLDYLVGTPFASSTRGQAKVFSGKDGRQLGTTWTKDRVGWSVSGVGDMDLDGHSDIVLGRPEDSTGGKSFGSVEVISGASVK